MIPHFGAGKVDCGGRVRATTSCKKKQQKKQIKERKKDNLMDHCRSRAESSSIHPKSSLRNIKSALWILFLILTGNESEKIVIF